MGDETQARSWAEMLSAIERRLVRVTGEDVATWRERVAATGLETEPEVRSWLAERGVTGYGRHGARSPSSRRPRRAGST